MNVLKKNGYDGLIVLIHSPIFQSITEITCPKDTLLFMGIIYPRLCIRTCYESQKLNKIVIFVT